MSDDVRRDFSWVIPTSFVTFSGRLTSAYVRTG